MHPSLRSTHVIFPKVTLPLSVGLHDHLRGFCLADSDEAGRHSWYCLREDKAVLFYHLYQ